MFPSDTLEMTQVKLREYIKNGVKLGWLINQRDQQVEIYRLEQAVEILQAPSNLSGETILPDFTLDLEWFWQL